MLSKNFTAIIVTTTIGAIGAVSYGWAKWTTETLIAVDKRTEVMAVQIDFIKSEMEKTYGNIPQSDVEASIQTSTKKEEN
tara:strand:- start:3444 stop:3683 length:240 start_codon:yes stop_codon:yes gene_type:complete